MEDNVVAIHNEEAAAEEATAANNAAMLIHSRDDKFVELLYNELLAHDRELAAQVENHKKTIYGMGKKKEIARKFKRLRTAYWKNKAQSIQKKHDELVDKLS